MEYDFANHVGTLLHDLDELSRYARLGGWTAVVRELEGVRRSLEGIGADLYGHAVIVAGYDEDGEAGV